MGVDYRSVQGALLVHESVLVWREQAVTVGLKDAVARLWARRLFLLFSHFGAQLARYRYAFVLKFPRGWVGK